ncbi:hypothetical protein [Microbacterium enclense]|uniref:hypothetical protein n=1 Tax=Microbacterium enclense TaxID=993073 RepID=UPI003F7DA846
MTSTDTRFPQYAKTTDPSVLATVRRNEEGRARFHRAACDFAQTNGVDDGSYFPSSFAGGHRLRAVGGDQRPTTGRWKRGYGGHGWVPYANNPLHDDFEALRFNEEQVPGLPSLVDGPYLPNGGHVVMTPRPFEVDGAVFVGFSSPPRADGDRHPDPADGGWVEILASEYHLASETYKARPNGGQAE